MDSETLRRARIARGITLDALIASTRLAPHIAEKIDSGRLDELPPGLYARSYVRMFAAEVGLDADAVLGELGPLLPPAPDPLPRLLELRQEPAVAWPWPSSAPRPLAAAVDGAIIASAVGALVLLTEASTGLAFDSSRSEVRLALAVVTVVLVAAYFLLLAGIGGRTPGQRIVGAPGFQAAGALTLPDVAQRALATGMAEGSILVDLLVARDSVERPVPMEDSA
jgi:hypothetical protein